MKEWQEKAYTFQPDDLESLFKQIIESQDITLPKLKRPIEADKVNDSKYCKYHRIVGHTLQDCFVFKDKLQELIDKNIVELDANIRAATTNVVFVDEDMVNLIGPQDNGDDSDDRDDWVIFESKVKCKRRLQAVKTRTYQTQSPPKRTQKMPLHLKEIIKKNEGS